MSAHAGGMCIRQCGHWRIRLFLFVSHANEKECKRIPYGVPSSEITPHGSKKATAKKQMPFSHLCCVSPPLQIEPALLGFDLVQASLV